MLLLSDMPISNLAIADNKGVDFSSIARKKKIV